MAVSSSEPAKGGTLYKALAREMWYHRLSYGSTLVSSSAPMGELGLDIEARSPSSLLN